MDYKKLQKAVLSLKADAFLKEVEKLDIKATSTSGTGMNILQYAITALPDLTVPFRELLKICVAKGLNLESKNKEGLTALHFAVAHKRLDPLRALIEMGAKIDPVDNDGFTPLYLAVSTYSGEPELLEIVRELLRKGADPNKKNNSGVSAKDFANTVGEGIDEGYNAKEWDLRSEL